nr:MAG TPA: hypothetical protein [Caudoviricetes sp.]
MSVISSISGVSYLVGLREFCRLRYRSSFCSAMACAAVPSSAKMELLFGKGASNLGDILQ